MTEPVPVDLLDGKHHALKFTARGMRAMSIAHGYRTLRDMALVLEDDVGLAAFLYAGLLWQQPAMTIEDACDLLDVYRSGGGQLGALAQAIGEALARSGHIARVRANGGVPHDPPVPAGDATATPPAAADEAAPNRLT